MFINSSPLKKLQNKWRFLVFVGILVAIVAVVVSLFFPLQYRADAQILVISKSRYGVDPYTAAKSAQQVGENLLPIVKTTDFYNKVILAPGHTLNKSYFENVSEKTKRQRWEKAIDVSVVYGTGVINVSAYHKDANQAKEYASAVADVLSASGWEYVGGDVIIKTVNEPLVTNYPARPNLLLNGLWGLMAGVLLAGVMLISKKS